MLGRGLPHPDAQTVELLQAFEPSVLRGIPEAPSVQMSAADTLRCQHEMCRNLFAASHTRPEIDTHRFGADNVKSADIARHSVHIAQLLIRQLHALAEGGTSMDEFVQTQAVIERAFVNTDVRSHVLKILQERGLLSHVPELHWTVNRIDYSKRIGLDVPTAFGRLAGSKRGKVLELGPGNGAFKKDMRRRAAPFTHMAIADRLYYPLAPLIEKLVDWKALEAKTGMPVPQEERQLLSDMLMKLLLIQDGKTDGETVAYDEEVKAALQKDVNAIVEHLPRKARRLAETKRVPDKISRHRVGEDGSLETYYPYDVLPADTPSFKAAADALTENCAAYLTVPKDVRSLVDVDAAGTLAGDLSKLQLVSGWANAIISVRAGVYKRGEDYVNLMVAGHDAMDPEGAYLGDDMRDNDGCRSRLKEWLLIRAKIRQYNPDVEISVITGPAFPGEDEYQGPRGVPLSVIMTPRAGTLDRIGGAKLLLSDKHQIRTLDELCADEEYLRLLDPSGRLLQEVRDANVQSEPRSQGAMAQDPHQQPILAA